MKVVKFTMGFAAIIAASLAMYAFTPSAPKPKADAQWYLFTSSDQSEVNDASKYEPVDYEPACSNGPKRCAIHAQPDVDGQPDLSTIDQIKKKS